MPYYFLGDLYRNRELLVSLTKRDLKNRYLGSALGMVWAFLQPLVTILVVWFVFQVGFKAKPSAEGVPFSLWLVSAMVPWFFFSEAFASAANSILEQGNIVKKIVFRVSLLPIVKINSALTVHFFFIIVLAFISIVYGRYPSIYWLQVPYYLLSSLILLLGLSWISSSVIVFFRDLGQVIGVLIQIGFWATPVFWDASIMPVKYHFLLKLNPVYYLTEGYRNCFCHEVWFWHNWKWMSYFWCVNAVIFICGIICFRKLKPHFADVL